MDLGLVATDSNQLNGSCCQLGDTLVTHAQTPTPTPPPCLGGCCPVDSFPLQVSNRVGFSSTFSTLRSVGPGRDL